MCTVEKQNFSLYCGSSGVVPHFHFLGGYGGTEVSCRWHDFSASARVGYLTPRTNILLTRCESWFWYADDSGGRRRAWSSWASNYHSWLGQYGTLKTCSSGKGGETPMGWSEWGVILNLYEEKDDLWRSSDRLLFGDSRMISASVPASREAADKWQQYANWKF